MKEVMNLTILTNITDFVINCAIAVMRTHRRKTTTGTIVSQFISRVSCITLFNYLYTTVVQEQSKKSTGFLST